MQQAVSQADLIKFKTSEEVYDYVMQNQLKWVIYSEQVYDVSDYWYHPGAEKQVAPYYGQSIDEVFEKSGHSTEAKSLFDIIPKMGFMFYLRLFLINTNPAAGQLQISPSGTRVLEQLRSPQIILCTGADCKHCLKNETKSIASHKEAAGKSSYVCSECSTEEIGPYFSKGSNGHLQGLWQEGQRETPVQIEISSIQIATTMKWGGTPTLYDELKKLDLELIEADEKVNHQILRTLGVKVNGKFRVAVALTTASMRGLDYRSSADGILISSLIAKSFVNKSEAIQGYYRVGRFTDKCHRVAFQDVGLIDAKARACIQTQRIQVFISSIQKDHPDETDQCNRPSRSKQEDTSGYKQENTSSQQDSTNKTRQQYHNRANQDILLRKRNKGLLSRHHSRQSDRLEMATETATTTYKGKRALRGTPTQAISPYVIIANKLSIHCCFLFLCFINSTIMSMSHKFAWKYDLSLFHTLDSRQVIYVSLQVICAFVNVRISHSTGVEKTQFMSFQPKS
ncbi:cytochrome b5-like [Stylonychia lemnae]|uniref:Cytochrome b5-like n=1 Tax=Stylonychia lemnae TaxID=5949 RepID=A0A078AM75_STYLE|nr:cytochrome b5-like [Stylonychia lemnae]|eukprot:CDW81933.1 cytochrome b5-like [Stylonychia lemnae]